MKNGSSIQTFFRIPVPISHSGDIYSIETSDSNKEVTDKALLVNSKKEGINYEIRFCIANAKKH